jgi:hypothetical protein
MNPRPTLREQRINVLTADLDRAIQPGDSTWKPACIRTTKRTHILNFAASTGIHPCFEQRPQTGDNSKQVPLKQRATKRALFADGQSETTSKNSLATRHY